MVARGGRRRSSTRASATSPSQLRAGDLLVVNESATLPAALPARRADGTALDAAPLDARAAAAAPTGVGREPTGGRRPLGRRAAPRRRAVRGAAPASRCALPGGGAADARRAVPRPRPALGRATRRPRAAAPPTSPPTGAPIRYAHQPRPRPLADHQTIFARVPGSAESPSAGRPVLARASCTISRARGIGVARLVLHTGVSSPERGERALPRALRRPRRDRGARQRHARARAGA